MLKIFILLLISMFSYAQEFSVFKENKKLGIINDSQLSQGYIIAETTIFAKAFFGIKNDYIIYSKNKPNIENKEFIKDKYGLLDILKNFKEINPQSKTNIIENENFLFNVKCNNVDCSYKGMNKISIAMFSGRIKFLNGNIYEITNDELQLLVRR